MSQTGYKCFLLVALFVLRTQIFWPLFSDDTKDGKVNLWDQFQSFVLWKKSMTYMKLISSSLWRSSKYYFVFSGAALCKISRCQGSWWLCFIISWINSFETCNCCLELYLELQIYTQFSPNWNLRVAYLG